MELDRLLEWKYAVKEVLQNLSRPILLEVFIKGFEVGHVVGLRRNVAIMLVINCVLDSGAEVSRLLLAAKDKETCTIDRLRR